VPLQEPWSLCFTTQWWFRLWYPGTSSTQQLLHEGRSRGVNVASLSDAQPALREDIVGLCLGSYPAWTLQVYRRGEKVVEHIAAEGGLDALEPVRPSLTLLSKLKISEENLRSSLPFSGSRHHCSGLRPLCARSTPAAIGRHAYPSQTRDDLVTGHCNLCGTLLPVNCWLCIQWI
jgi:hypothetical protein